MKKKLFQKKIFWAKFLSFYCFFLYVCINGITKKFSWIFAQFWPKYLKNYFWAYVMRQALFLWL